MTDAPTSKPRILEREITVCNECLTACCWLGLFYCQAYKTAGTVDMSVAALHKLDRESPEYWFKSPHTGAIDQHALAEFHAAIGAA